MQCHDVRKNKLLALCVRVCVIPQVSPFYQKNQVLLASTYQQISREQDVFLLLHKFHRSITDWIGFGLGWLGDPLEVLLQVTVERVFQLADVQM